MRAERAIGGGMKWVVLSVWLNIKAIINCWKWLQGRKSQHKNTYLKIKKYI